jgi:hypothetical protein
MQHQDTLLPGAVYRHKAQHWPLQSFTDGLGWVILLAFPMGPDRDRRNQPQIMTQYLQFARPVMQRCTSRKADQAGTALGAEAHNLATPQLPVWHDSSATADRVPLKNIPCHVDADDLAHGGWCSSLTSITTPAWHI